MRVTFAILFAFLSIFSPLSFSMTDESIPEKVLSPKDLNKDNLDKPFTNEKIVLSGTFEREGIWDDLVKKIPNVRELSLRFVNQPTFRTLENHKNFFAALKKLKKLEKLSLKKQFFIDEDLKDIPETIKYLDLSETQVSGYGLEYLSKDVQVTGINK
jgi:hypothetical protein